MFFLKFYRRLQSGINPELEIGRYLTEVVRFPNIVPVAGAAEYRNSDGTVVTLALLQAFVMNQGDGWDYTVNYLVRFLEERRGDAPVPEDAHGLYLELVKTLATRTAELHRALSTPTQDEAFSAGADHERRISRHGATTCATEARRDPRAASAADIATACRRGRGRGGAVAAPRGAAAADCRRWPLRPHRA